MASRRAAAAAAFAAAEEEEENDENEIQELYELSTMVSTIDRIVVTLKRLTATVSAGGDLYEAQKDFQDALLGQGKRPEEDESDPKRARLAEELSESDHDYDEEEDEEES